ncbi:MAG: tetratricopeptide repeat protein [Chloroflexota bacterium]
MKNRKRKQRRQPKGEMPKDIEFEYGEHMLQQLRMQLLSLPQDKQADRARAPIMAQMAQVYWRIGKTDEAINIWQQNLKIAEEIKDDMLWSLSVMGLSAIYSQEGNDEEAIKYSQMALSKDPNNPDAMMSLGSACYNSGKSDEALMWWLRVIEHKPNEFFAYECVAGYYIDKHDYDTAQTYFDQVIKRNPDSLTVYGSLGNMYLTQGRYKEALVQFKEAVRLQPRAHIPYNNVGNCYLRMGNHEKARLHYEKSIRLNADEALWPNIGMGLLYRSLPNGKGLAKSAAFFQKAIEIYHSGKAKIHSTTMGHRSRYAMALTGLGDDKAAVAWQEILDDPKSHIDFDYALVADCVESIKVIADCDDPPPNVGTILAMLEQERQNRLGN